MSQFGKKSAKLYHSLYTVVKQSNCRWYCEPTFSLRWAFNQEKSLHTFPLQSLSISYPPSLILPSTNPPSRLLVQFDY
jgi:hypothetical protein